MKPMPTDDHARPSRALLWKTALLASVLGLGTWLILNIVVPRELPRDFPKLPDLRARNAELRKLLSSADAEARDHPT